MLARNSYPQDYVDACRTKVAAQVDTYQALAAAAAGKAKAALEALEPVFFNNMVLELETFFTHRTRGMEGKDGNPLNEVRVLCTSLMENDGVLAKDKQIKLDPASTVLGLEVGDEIKVTQAEFERLAEAFFKEIEARFPDE
jgi:hypothetical protein